MNDKEPDSINQPAGFWIRLAAHSVDSVIMLMVKVGTGTAATALMPLGSSRLFLDLALFTVLHMLYYVLLTGRTGQTAGKLLFGIRVVGVAGESIGYGRAVRRWLGYLVSYLSLGYGFYMAGIRADKRASHDLLAGTKVMRVAPYSPSLQAVCATVGLVFSCFFPYLLLMSLTFDTFERLLTVSHEGTSKGNLNAIRSAISIYFGDREGVYPGSLSTGPDSPFSLFMDALPAVTETHAGIGAGTVESPSGTQVLVTTDENITVKGRGWRYNPETGRIFINSCATDSRGVPYSCYGY